MEIKKAYRFKLKPSDEQVEQLHAFCGCARFVWNKVWAWNRDRLEKHLPLVWYQEADFYLKLWKKSDEYGFLKAAPSHVLQQKLRDLDKAYRDGFDKNQPLKRMPRAKRRGIGDSIRFPEMKHVQLDNRRVKLPKIGWIGFFKDRNIKGRVKNATVRREADGWYLSVQVEQTLPELHHPSTDDVGIDLGIEKFAALSNGITIEPVHAYKKYRKQLAHAQKDLSRKVKFSNNWKKQKQRIGKIHHKIACCRNDFLHQTSHRISKNHAMLFVEDLKVANMSRSAKGSQAQPGRNVRAKAGLNRSILDQGWGEFRRQLEYKSQWRGGRVVAVPPHHTSQECSECGHIHPANRKSQSRFECQACGHSENADINEGGHRVLAVEIRCNKADL